MKIRLISKKSIHDFAAQHAKSRSALKHWLTLIKMDDWDEPSDICETFGSADLLGNGSNRVVFDIAGNNFRMICKYHFGEKQIYLYVKWIGTHAEYSKICNNNKQYTITDF